VRPGWSDPNTDFLNYWVGARVLIEGGDVAALYDDARFNAWLASHGIAHVGKFSTFPPPTAFLLVPVAWLDPLSALRVWTIAKVALVAVHVGLLRRVTGWTWDLCLLLLLASGQALARDFQFGQAYLPLSVCLTWAWVLWEEGRPRASGAALAVAAAVKLFPVIFLAALATRGRGALGGAALAGLSVSALSLAVLGAAPYVAWGSGVLPGHLGGELSMQSPYSVSYQSWNALLRTVFVAHPIDNPSPSLPWTLAFPVAYGLVVGAVGASLAASLRRTRRLAQAMAVRWALVGIAAMVLLPVSATYHFLLLVLPMALLTSRLDLGRVRVEATLLVATYAAIGLLPYGLLGRVAEIAPPLAWSRLGLVSLLWILAVVCVHRAQRA
jgi:hypothetical protein